MKYVLISLLMVFAIGISIPSATIVKAEETQVCFDFDVEDTAPEFVDTTNSAIQRKPVILPPVQQLDVKRLYLRNYFNGLNQNFGYNWMGTCDYIALGMMFSYYDSYLNDDIIPEECDVPSTGGDKDMINRNNSPGFLFDIINNDDAKLYASKDTARQLTNVEYCNVLSGKYGSKSFQLRLIELAAKNEWLKLDGSAKFITSPRDLIKLCKEFLNTAGFEEGKDYDVITYIDYYSNNMKKFITENIDAGRPVYCSGFNNKTGQGHAFVCYDYESLDKIYAHMGWFLNTIHTDQFELYGDAIDAFAIDFKIEHTHSYNYMVGNKAYCYCDEEIETYHNHNYTYVGVNKTNHRASCNCGKSYLTLHYIVGSTSGRYAKCGACGMTLDLNDGPYIRIMSLSKTPNGSYISQSGIPVIMEGDVEAYLNGTLKFGSGIEDYSYIN